MGTCETSAGSAKIGEDHLATAPESICEGGLGGHEVERVRTTKGSEPENLEEGCVAATGGFISDESIERLSGAAGVVTCPFHASFSQSSAFETLGPQS